ncbi:MAG TPA: hypothetical protein ENJ82_04695 [Bacteroidetes bacterium]|nr:hypothetical protein [Bacteroidota bacterium]
MENQFHSRMVGLSDAQLNELLLSRKDYVPMALEAAEEELRSRGVSRLDLEALTAEGLAREELAYAKAELPLPMGEQILYFIFAFFIVTPFVAFFYRRFADRGEDLRAWTSIRQVLLGLLFYAALNGIIQRFLYYFG